MIRSCRRKKSAAGETPCLKPGSFAAVRGSGNHGQSGLCDRRESEQDQHRIAAAIHNQGHANYGRGTYLDAAVCFLKSLELRQALDDRIGISLDMLWTGLCLARLGKGAEAVRRLSEAESRRKQTGAMLARVDQAALNEAVSTLKQAAPWRA